MGFFQFPPVEGPLTESNLKSLKRAFIRAHKSFSPRSQAAMPATHVRSPVSEPLGLEPPNPLPYFSAITPYVWLLREISSNTSCSIS